MRWLKDLKIEDSGQVFYKGIEIDLSRNNKRVFRERSS